MRWLLWWQEMKHQHLKVNFNLTAIQQRAALCPEKAALSNVTAFSTSLLCIASWDGACASYWCHLKVLLGIEVQNVHTLITCRHLERQTCWVSWQCFDLELQNVREKQKIRANNLCVICVIICIAIVPQPWHLRIPQQMNYFDCLSFF